MIVLLNLACVFVGFMGIGLSYKLHKAWPMCVALVLIISYSFIQPSYMPKGEVKRSEIPLFEQKGRIEDRNTKPKSGEQYDVERETAVKEGLPFK